MEPSPHPECGWELQHPHCSGAAQRAWSRDRARIEARSLGKGRSVGPLGWRQRVRLGIQPLLPPHPLYGPHGSSVLLERHNPRRAARRVWGVDLCAGDAGRALHMARLKNRDSAPAYHNELLDLLVVAREGGDLGVQLVEAVAGAPQGCEVGGCDEPELLGSLCVSLCGLFK